jgi:hypothetical protein
MEQAWRELGRKISSYYAEGPQKNDEPLQRGELVVLGSGLAIYDRTADIESELVSADHVFYCLCDRLTQVWVSKLRPDALDLAALYDERVERYATYARMAEAMLFYVRQGRKVVAILYGHPGVFATPAHRAIKIARSEGHRARMRPGISALDYLVADLGFDPALPGLQSFEATDLLLRRRTIDPSLHIVLWQVGVVGELGFKADGFAKIGLPELQRVLIETYGPDWAVVHYVAPQYAGVEPLIENILISDLLKPETRGKLSAVSTFYIAPQLAVETDEIFARQIGLIGANDPPPPPERDWRVEIYADREIAALRQLDDMQFPATFSVTPPSPAADFVMALGENEKLRTEYRSDPEKLLNSGSFDSLSERSRRLLSINHPASIATALWEAEGSLVDLAAE